MKRQGFIDYEGSGAVVRRIERTQTARNPISVGVICTGAGIDTVLDLEVDRFGNWSLVDRRYGASTGKVLAEGTITKEEA